MGISLYERSGFFGKKSYIYPNAGVSLKFKLKTSGFFTYSKLSYSGKDGMRKTSDIFACNETEKKSKKNRKFRFFH